MQNRRSFTLVAALLVAAAGAVPAFAQGLEKLAGIERALEVAAEAIDWAQGEPAESSGAVVPETSVAVAEPEEDRPQPGTAGKGNRGKGNVGKGDVGKGNSARGNSGKGEPGKGDFGNDERGNDQPENHPGTAKSDKAESDKVTGRERAATAIAEAFERQEAHFAEVLERVRVGEPPRILEDDSSYGPRTSAMIRAYNDLQNRDEVGPS